MAIFPVRELSKYGVIADVDAYSLPTEAWSMALNVRFQDGYVERGPVFRDVLALATTEPRHVSADEVVGGFSSIVVGYLNGSVASISNGTETDISISGYTPTNSENPYTTCKLGQVFYVNRGDRIPWSLRTSDTIMQPLANWDATWRAKLLRSCGGALCAFGITKSGVSYPTMVKTSEFAIADTVPSTWDETSTTNNATENILGEMRSEITEAQPLGEIMIVYGLNETWTMQADGSSNVWSYHKLFDTRGAINANCAIEVDKMHYVFGHNDIWWHDGISPQSICDKRTRRFIYNSLNMDKANRCCVSYNPSLNEVSFYYVSSDPYAAFPPVDGCNRAAVYNISENNWTFYDMPYVFSAVMANVDHTDTWDVLGRPWSELGGTWLDEQESLKRVLVMVGRDDTAAAVTKTLYVFDMPGDASVSALPVNLNATKPWQLYKDGLDLDELAAPLSGYKLCSSIYPQGRLDPDAAALTFQVGAADYYSQSPTWFAPQTYDADLNYKLDYNVTGRFLSIKAYGSDYHYFKLTGIDLELDVLGER